MEKLNNENPRIKVLEQQKDTYKTFAITAGASASLSAILVANSLLLGNTSNICCLGSGLAMVSYAINYLRQIKNNNLEIRTYQENTGLSDIKQTLIKLKHQLERSKIYKTSHNMAAGGFLLSAIISIFNLINAESLNQKLSSAIVLTLSSLVSLGDILYNIESKERLEQTSSDIEYYETLSEIEDSIKEGKEPEEVIAKKLSEQIRKIGK